MCVWVRARARVAFGVEGAAERVALVVDRELLDETVGPRGGGRRVGPRHAKFNVDLHRRGRRLAERVHLDTAASWHAIKLFLLGGEVGLLFFEARLDATFLRCG
eukprot:4337994-Pleurochrysis_carterae.AAC.3